MANFRTTQKFTSAGTSTDGYDVWTNRTDGVDTLFAKDVNDMVDSVREVQRSLLDGYAVATILPRSSGITFQDGQTLVYSSSQNKLVVGASGDASFKIQSVAANGVFTIKGGYLILSDGRELATYSGSGTATSNFGVDLNSLDLDNIPLMAGVSLATKTFYLYIDLLQLSPITITTGTAQGRTLYGVSSETQFALSTQAPNSTSIAQSRYIPIGYVRNTTGTLANWSSTIFGTLASRRHETISVNTNPVVYKQTNITASSHPAGTVITHNMNVPTTDQRWSAVYVGSDGYTLQLDTTSWLANIKTANSIEVDFSFLSAGDSAVIKLENSAISATNLPVATYDTGVIAANTLNALLPISHGLGQTPTSVVLQRETGNAGSGRYENLNAGDYLDVSNLTIVGDLSTLGTDNVRLVASSVLSAIAVSNASATVSGLVSTTAQTFAGQKTFNGALQMAGGLLQNSRTVTSTSSLLATDSIVLAAPASAAITLTLPAAAAGLTLTVKRNSASYLVYLTPASGTIDGASSITLNANYQAMSVISDGTNWFII